MPTHEQSRFYLSPSIVKYNRFVKTLLYSCHLKKSAAIVEWFQYMADHPEWIDEEEELYAQPC